MKLTYYNIIKIVESHCRNELWNKKIEIFLSLFCTYTCLDLKMWFYISRSKHLRAKIVIMIIDLLLLCSHNCKISIIYLIFMYLGTSYTIIIIWHCTGLLVKQSKKLYRITIVFTRDVWQPICAAHYIIIVSIGKPLWRIYTLCALIDCSVI